jgi:hypothetical protein
MREMSDRIFLASGRVVSEQVYPIMDPLDFKTDDFIELALIDVMGISCKIVVELAFRGKLHNPEVAGCSQQIWLHRAAYQSWFLLDKLQEF